MVKGDKKCRLLCDKPELEGASSPASLLKGEGDIGGDEDAFDKPCCIPLL